MEQGKRKRDKRKELEAKGERKDRRAVEKRSLRKWVKRKPKRGKKEKRVRDRSFTCKPE